MVRTPQRRSTGRGTPPDPDAVAQRRRRAAEEALDLRLRSRAPFVDLEVRNPVHRTTYRVVFPEYPVRDGALCTCTDFARRGLGTCKHVEAAWEWLRSTPPLADGGGPAAHELPVGDVWKEVDARLQSSARSSPSRIRDLEEAGTALFEGVDGRKRKEGVGEKVGRPRPADASPRPTSRGRP